MRMSGMDERGVGKCIRWFFNHNSWSPGHLEICRSFAAIQLAEKNRIHQFMYQADAKASLVGRLMLRKAVCLLGELTNKQIKLSRTGRGRPFPENLPELQINISHAGDLTVLAAQRVNAEDIDKDENQDRFLLGVDVMPICDSRIDRTENFFRLMRKQFTDYEWETILSEPSEEKKLECFYRHWSLKESYVKAVGTGLNLDLRTIEFKLFSNPEPGSCIFDTQVWLNQEKGEDWKFEESLLQDHVVSVAVKTKFQDEFHPEKWREVELEDLLPKEQDLISQIDPEDWILFSAKEKTKPF